MIFKGRIEIGFQPFLSSVKIETRTAMANILGIVATAQLDEADRIDKLNKLFEDLLGMMKDKSKQVCPSNGIMHILAA